MTREDIIRMARSLSTPLGLAVRDNITTLDSLSPEDVDELIFLAYSAGAAAEHEACAKQLDALGKDHCSAAIRARGQTIAGFPVVLDESIPPDTFKVVGAKQA